MHEVITIIVLCNYSISYSIHFCSLFEYLKHSTHTSLIIFAGTLLLDFFPPNNYSFQLPGKAWGRNNDEVMSGVVENFEAQGHMIYLHTSLSFFSIWGFSPATYCHFETCGESYFYRAVERS